MNNFLIPDKESSNGKKAKAKEQMMMIGSLANHFPSK
jgi:hypothetical protein